MKLGASAQASATVYDLDEDRRFIAPIGNSQQDVGKIAQVHRLRVRLHESGTLNISGSGYQIKQDGTVGRVNRDIYGLHLNHIPADLRAEIISAMREAARRLAESLDKTFPEVRDDQGALDLEPCVRAGRHLSTQQHPEVWCLMGEED